MVCAGLQADVVARQCGIVPEARIVPFRGEYFELAQHREHLVRGLIYPVPDPRFPFLGVHLTRMVRGGVHAGPNAVLALRREGYAWRDVDLGELRDSLSWPGLWRLGAKHAGSGAREVVRSLSRAAFARSVARLVPGIEARDLVPAPAGVRAQALRRDGSLVDDFLVQTAPRQVHVLNAPSPAATASLEIAEHLVAQVDSAVLVSRASELGQRAEDRALALLAAHRLRGVGVGPRHAVLVLLLRRVEDRLRHRTEQQHRGEAQSHGRPEPGERPGRRPRQPAHLRTDTTMARTIGTTTIARRGSGSPAPMRMSRNRDAMVSE